MKIGSLFSHFFAFTPGELSAPEPLRPTPVNTDPSPIAAASGVMEVAPWGPQTSAGTLSLEKADVKLSPIQKAVYIQLGVHLDAIFMLDSLRMLHRIPSHKKTQNDAFSFSINLESGQVIHTAGDSAPENNCLVVTIGFDRTKPFFAISEDDRGTIRRTLSNPSLPAHARQILILLGWIHGQPFNAEHHLLYLQQVLDAQKTNASLLRQICSLEESEKPFHQYIGLTPRGYIESLESRPIKKTSPTTIVRVCLHYNSKNGRFRISSFEQLPDQPLNARQETSLLRLMS